MKPFETLTPEQEAILAGVRDEWLGYGLSCEPANRALAEEGVREAYAAAGLEPPKIIVWLDSPMAGALGQAYYLQSMPIPDRDQVSDQVWGQVRDQVSGQVWGQVRDQVWDQVRNQVSGQVWDQVSGQVRDQVSDQVRDQVSDQVSDQVRGQVWDQVSDQVRDQVSDQVRGQVRGQVWGQVSDQVSDQVWDQVRDQVSGQVWDQVSGQVSGQVWENLNSWSRACIWGQHDVGYLAFTAAMQKIGVPKLDAITGLQKVAQNAGWWWAFKGAVVLTDRPAELHRDKDFRLHSEDGPAIRYRDGFGMYLWHGTRVPADLIETGWTTERIFQEKNTEVRRCAIERLGWPEFIESSGMTRVGEPVPDPGNAPHEIALYDLPKNLADMYDEKARILLATNGSPERDGSIHKFGLVVPGHHTDPVAAAADLFGWPRAAYAALEVRR